MSKAAAHYDIAYIYSEYFTKLKEQLINWSRENDQSIEDVLQDAFIKLHIHLHQGREIENTYAWLYRVSQNILRDQYRKRTTHKEIPTAIDQLQLSSEDTDLQSSTHGPEDCLPGIIASLPWKYKKAVYLTDIKGIPQKDSAQSLGIPISTFKSHVQRGRRLVTQGYMKCCDYTLDKNGHLQGQSKDWSECRVCSETL